MTFKGRIVSIVIGLAILAAIAELSIRIGMPEWREFYSGRFMRQIIVPGQGGVSIGRPNFDGYFSQNNGDFRVQITINDFGLRNAASVGEAHDRIWFIGDSMTFGWGVERDEIYSSVTEKIVGIPTYNVASPGTDICGYRALYARMPDKVRPRAVVIGLVMENDIALYDCLARAKRRPTQSGSEFQDIDVSNITLGGIKRLLTRFSASYNLVAVSVKRVSSLTQFMSLLGAIEPDHGYRNQIQGDVVGAAIEKTVNEIDGLRKLIGHKTEFAVLLVPARFEIRDHDAYYKNMRLSLRRALTVRNIQFIDPVEKFQSHSLLETHFAHDGHWNALGHRIAGEVVANWIRGIDERE